MTDEKPILIKTFLYFIIIPCIIITGICVAVYIYEINITELGPLGDLFNGLIGPFIATLAAFITYNAWSSQIEANNLQRIAFQGGEINNMVTTLINTFRTEIDNSIVLVEDNNFPEKRGLTAIEYIITQKREVEDEIKNFDQSNPNYENLKNRFKEYFTYYQLRSECNNQNIDEFIIPTIIKDRELMLAISIFAFPKYQFLESLSEMLSNIISFIEHKEKHTKSKWPEEQHQYFFKDIYVFIKINIPKNLSELLLLELKYIKNSQIKNERISNYKKIGLL